MIGLGQAIASLVDRLTTSSCVPNQLIAHFSWTTDRDFFSLDPLEWLNAQTVFPQFYWQPRDAEEEIIALGQIKTFICPIKAEKSLQGEQRIWGGYAFDAKPSSPSSYFFLPQIELTRRGNTGTLILNVADDILHAQLVLSKLIITNQYLCSPTCHVVSTFHQPKHSRWLKMVGNALETIEKTKLQKVVLARKTTLVLDRAISGAQLLKASRAVNKGNFHFLLAIDESNSFVGSTPERLFCRRKLAISTEALAGTIGRGQFANEDRHLAQWLLNDDKNAHENSLVVDDITERLTPFCHQLDVEEKPHLLRLRSVQHLKRDISACLHQHISSASLLNTLHPTAAIAGLPREIALNFIKENEPFERGWYSGSVGYLSKESSEFCVGIRSALVKGNVMHLFAGAGIVLGSVAIHEWDELDKKMATLMSLLTPFYDAQIREQKVG